MSVIGWLLEGDPAIRWQVLGDLTDAPAGDVAAERARVEHEGWGARLLALEDPDGLWDGGACTAGQILQGEIMTEQPADIPGYIAGAWDIDPVHSHIGFIARHLMVSKVRGNFTKFEGEIITAANPLESSARVTVDTSSLDTGNETRDDDVKGEGFLDVANYPAMTFQSTSVHRSGEDLIMTGDLTIKGVTRLVELGIEINGFGPDPYGGTRAGFTATYELYRSDYGITANTVLPTGGVVVSDEIQLVLDVEASLRTS